MLGQLDICDLFEVPNLGPQTLLSAAPMGPTPVSVNHKAWKDRGGQALEENMPYEEIRGARPRLTFPFLVLIGLNFTVHLSRLASDRLSKCV